MSRQRNIAGAFFEGGILITTHKKDIPELAEASAMPDILLRTVIHPTGDVLNLVEHKLVTDPEYQELVPKVYAKHTASVNKAVPHFGRIRELMDRWLPILGDLSVVAGLVEQINSGEFPNWTAIASVVGGLTLNLVKKAAVKLIEWLIRREFERLMAEAETDASAEPAVAEGN